MKTHFGVDLSTGRTDGEKGSVTVDKCELVQRLIMPKTSDAIKKWNATGIEKEKLVCENLCHRSDIYISIHSLLSTFSDKMSSDDIFDLL